MNTSILSKKTRRRGMLVETCTEQLRLAIQNGEIDSSHGFIQEKKLYQELNISKGTLRKCLAILQEENLLKSIPYKGYILGPSAPAKEPDKKTQILFVQQAGLGNYNITSREESVLHSAKLEAKKLGLELQECCLDQEDLVQEIKELIENGTLAGVGLEYYHKEFSQLLLANGIPSVMVECGNIYPQFDSVSQDDRDGIEKAVWHLWDQGHRDLALVAWLKTFVQPLQRRAAFAESLLRREVEHPANIGMSLRFDAKGGAEAVQKIFSAKTPPTALILSHLEMATGVLDELKKRGLEPGKDISLISWGTEELRETLFKNTDWEGFPLDLITWSRENMGKMMVRMLHARIQEPGIPRMAVEIKTELKLFKFQ